MRTTAQSPALKAAAIAGTYVVVLAWNLRDATKRKGLLGFSLARTEFDENDDVVEQYWMRGIKRFRDKDEGLAAGTPVPTSEHPIQTFQWADYTAKSASHYRYTIVPVYGTPKLLVHKTASAVEIDAWTEEEIDYADVPSMSDASSTSSAANAPARHDIFFNRGVIGSQAYARRFENEPPDPNDPTSDKMVWLSRGLFEALLGFIALAEADGYGLRAALYEFHYQPVANAFAKAIEAGGDVKIVYDGESPYKVGNLATIVAAGLNNSDAVFARTVSEGLRHNKFIVLMKDDVPIAVWTGSTNISPGGIFGHSNVGHIVWDTNVARKYFEYWERLESNLTPTKLREPNRIATPTPAAKTPKNSVVPLFSARDNKDSNATLQWYADRMAEAKRIVCLTVAFNLDVVFQDVISQENDVLRYIVKDDDLGSGETVGHDGDVLFAAGGYLGFNALANFLKEIGNPLNTNDYIHTKFMLVDPLSTDPLVVTGSANFSRPSQRINDENMLVIRGDTRVADIYFGEYMRIFDHHYARYVVRKLTQQDNNDPNAGYLKPTDIWTKSHFDPKSYKAKRRKYFVAVKATV